MRLCFLMLRTMLAIALVALCLTEPAQADSKATTRNNCRTLPKYKLQVWAGPNSADRSYGASASDKGCGYAQAIAASLSNPTNRAYIKERIGSGAMHYQWTKGTGWHKAGQRRDLGSIPPSASAWSFASWNPYATFDSLAQTITVTFDSLRISASNDSAYQAVRVYAWAGVNDQDSVRTPSKVFWSGTFRLRLGQLTTSGGYSNSDFVYTPGPDSTVVTAIHLTKTFPFDAPGLLFDNAQVDVECDGGYGLEGPFPPPFVPTLDQWGLAVLSLLLVASGAVFLVRK